MQVSLRLEAGGELDLRVAASAGRAVCAPPSKATVRPAPFSFQWRSEAREAEWARLRSEKRAAKIALELDPIRHCEFFTPMQQHETSCNLGQQIGSRVKVSGPPEDWCATARKGLHHTQRMCNARLSSPRLPKFNPDLVSDTFSRTAEPCAPRPRPATPEVTRPPTAQFRTTRPSHAGPWPHIRSEEPLDGTDPDVMSVLDGREP